MTHHVGVDSGEERAFGDVIPSTGLTSGTQPGRRDRRARPIPVASALVALLGVGSAIASVELSLGELNQPGPGLWPFILAVAMVVIATVLVFVDDVDDYEPWTMRTAGVSAGTLSLAVYIVAFEQWGLLLPTIGLLAFWLRVFGRETWALTILIAVSGALVLQGLFSNALGVPFPEGPSFLPNVWQ